MYLLAVDESGTHSGANALVIAGVAVHENDVRALENALHNALHNRLAPLGVDPYKFEIHDREMRVPSPGKAATDGHPPTQPSEWHPIAGVTRLQALDDVYDGLAQFQPADPRFPPRIIAAIVDRKHPKHGAITKAENYAYDHVLHRFDEMLTRLGSAAELPQRGLILHDRQDRLEKTIQIKAAGWQRDARRLDTLLQVPIFTDSRASRLLQAADLVCSALARQYLPEPDDSRMKPLWDLAERDDRGRMPGVMHLALDFNTCPCPPCTSRSAVPRAR